MAQRVAKELLTLLPHPSGARPEKNNDKSSSAPPPAQVCRVPRGDSRSARPPAAPGRRLSLSLRPLCRCAALARRPGKRKHPKPSLKPEPIRGLRMEAPLSLSLSLTPSLQGEWGPTLSGELFRRQGSEPGSRSHSESIRTTPQATDVCRAPGPLLLSADRGAPLVVLCVCVLVAVCCLSML